MHVRVRLVVHAAVTLAVQTVDAVSGQSGSTKDDLVVNRPPPKLPKKIIK
jgi:hypothetical protein